MPLPEGHRVALTKRENQQHRQSPFKALGFRDQTHLLLAVAGIGKSLVSRYPK